MAGTTKPQDSDGQVNTPAVLVRLDTLIQGMSNGQDFGVWKSMLEASGLHQDTSALGRLLLHACASIRSRHLFALLDLGANPNAQENWHTPFTLLGRAGCPQPEMMAVAKAGANINAVDGIGYTALHYAALLRHGAVPFLLGLGADSDVRTGGGRRAIDVLLEHTTATGEGFKEAMLAFARAGCFASPEQWQGNLDRENDKADCSNSTKGRGVVREAFELCLRLQERHALDATVDEAGAGSVVRQRL